MNKSISIILFVLISIIFITLQSTLLSPRNVGYVFPDLNLILIVFLAVYSEVRGSFLIATGNGYMMDVLSGNLPGTFTISRLSAYLLVRTSSNHVYLKKWLIQGLVIFLATIFSWTFITVIFKIKQDTHFTLTLSEIMAQDVVNTIVGVPLFWVIVRLHAKLQK
jgi:rod shape-determining protein MreD